MGTGLADKHRRMTPEIKPLRHCPAYIRTSANNRIDRVRLKHSKMDIIALYNIHIVEKNDSEQ